MSSPAGRRVMRALMMAKIDIDYHDGTRIAVEAYRRIVKAADKGRGVHLSAEEVECIVTMDDAIPTAASNDWPWDNNNKEKR